MKIFNKIIAILTVSLISSVIFAADTKPIVFATEASYPPFESMNSQGQMQGFDIDIIKAICDHVQLSCKFINQPWDSLIPGLQLGKFDVIFGSLMITAERQKQVSFTDPYFKNTGVFVAAKSAHLSLAAADLKGKIIGLQVATPFEDYVRSVYGKNVTVKRYNSIQDALLDLQAGRVDSVFGDSVVMLEWLKNPINSNAYTQIGEPIDNEQYFGVGNGLAVKKSNTELLKILNTGLLNIKNDGSYQKIVDKYFGDKH